MAQENSPDKEKRQGRTKKPEKPYVEQIDELLLVHNKNDPKEGLRVISKMDEKGNYQTGVRTEIRSLLAIIHVHPGQWICNLTGRGNLVPTPGFRVREIRGSRIKSSCHKYPGTVSAALLDDHSKAVSLHTKSLR